MEQTKMSETRTHLVRGVGLWYARPVVRPVSRRFALRGGGGLSARSGSPLSPDRAAHVGEELLAPPEGIQAPLRALVIRTQPNREQVADSFLQKFGFETYFPQVRSRVRHARQWQDVDHAFFPMYLFVWDHRGLNHRELRRAPGVSAVLHMGEDPASVLKKVLDGIRAREVVVPAIRKPGETVQRIVLESLPDIGPEFVQGESLAVTDGPMVGLTALFVCKKGKDRADVLVRLLGQWSPVSIKTKYLERS